MDYSTGQEPDGLEERLVAALQRGPATRSQLCDELGTSRTVLGRALTALMADGAVTVQPPDPTAVRGRGRPVEHLGLARNVARAIGIDVSRARATGVVLDRAGSVLSQTCVRYDSFDSWLAPLRELCAALAGDVDARGVRTAYLAEIGVGLPVPVGHETWRRRHEPGSLVHAITEEVGRYFRAPILVDNTVRMAALGEARWGAGRHGGDQLYVRLSAGVGGCVATADRLTGGGTGYAGELGHVRVPSRSAACYCGKAGCLETVASVPAVCTAAGVSGLDALRTRLDAGDARATSAVEEAARAVGLVCATVVLVLSPRLVVVGGELTAHVPEILPLMRDVLRAELIPTLDWSVDVVAAELDAARGAAAAALSYRASQRAAPLLSQDHR